MQELRRIVISTQTFPPRVGGMEAVMYSLACRLAKNEIEVLVAADKPYTEKLPFTLQSFNLPRVVRPLAKRISLSRLKPAPETVICDSWKSVGSVPNWSAKLIVLAHGQEYLEPNPKKEKRIRDALARASIVVASSKMTAELVEAISPSTEVRVVPPTYMLRSPEIPLERVTRSQPNILTLCRIEKRKGLFQSALALAALKEKGIGFNWTIAGSGPDLQELKSEIDRLGLSEQTQFCGRVDNKTKTALLANADLFLMPSYQAGKSLEGFGISYVEAASFGVPSVAGIAGGAPEAVLDGITGWCIDGSDHEAVERCLVIALCDEKSRRNYGDAAAARFNREFIGDVVFDRFVSLLSE